MSRTLRSFVIIPLIYIYQEVKIAPEMQQQIASVNEVLKLSILN